MVAGVVAARSRVVESEGTVVAGAVIEEVGGVSKAAPKMASRIASGESGEDSRATASVAT